MVFFPSVPTHSGQIKQSKATPLLPAPFRMIVSDIQIKIVYFAQF